MADFKVITPHFVNVHITTSNNDISFAEKRFPKDITISSLKAKLELMTGGSCSTMKIEAYDKENKLVCSLSEDNALLGSYPIDNGIRLHVIDKFSLRNELDFGDVDKFELSQKEYSERADSVKSFLVKNKLGQYNSENKKKKEELEKKEQELAESLLIGARCQITVQDSSPRLGTVKYAGKVEGLSGYWVGVKYDEPVGKNDGSLKGKRYFECPEKYGGFVKPQSVTVGDFPEENYDLLDEI